MYKADVSSYKQGSREIILNELYQITPKRKQLRNIITLCNKNFVVEKDILKRYPLCKVESFEYNRRVFSQALKRKPSKVKLSNEDIFQHDFSSKEYDFVWLDLCNSYTEDIINKIIEFVSKLRFTHHSMFIVTLNKARGRNQGKFKFGQYYGNYKNSGVVYHIGNFIKSQIDEVKVLQYSCQDLSSRANQMQAFIFKLNCYGINQRNGSSQVRR